MTAANLHTLANDILYDILTCCSDLITLRSLILTQSTLYRVFNSHRRLILRIVFRSHNDIHSSKQPAGRDVAVADAFILRTNLNPIESVALREAFWPELERLLPTKLPLKWATALLACYHTADLGGDALIFAKRTMGLILKTSRPLHLETRAFSRAVIRTYLAAKLPEEAIELQQKILQYLDPRSSEHSIWAKQLVTIYRNTQNYEPILRLQFESWQTYSTVLGPDNEVTLDWARSIVSEYQSMENPQEAIQFHQNVRNLIDPMKTIYVAWSRQLIRMHRRLGQDAEALIVTEEVWGHLQPDSAGYRAWTAQLSEQYEAAGRPEDAIAVCEAAWTAISGQLARSPGDTAWKYHARGAGLMLAKAYHRYQRSEDARSLEAVCQELDA